MTDPPRRRCNDLPGSEWLRYSLSVWSDVRKSSDELALGHPAMFPSMLCERLIRMFLRQGERRVLDPFMGTGSTLVAAKALGMQGVGLEINPAYIELARERLEAPDLFRQAAPPPEIHQADARTLRERVPPESIDLCITSPPYWDILNQKRTADSKDVRHYGNLDGDLGTIADYEAFLDELATVFRQVLAVLRPGAYCIVVVMDLRKKSRFFPFHSDLAGRLANAGFLYDDLIVWDRGQEYNNLRPLGYPSVFRVNKVHEFVLIFQKPAGR
jgi:DNA modification methylase